MTGRVTINPINADPIGIVVRLNDVVMRMRKMKLTRFGTTGLIAMGLLASIASAQETSQETSESTPLLVSEELTIDRRGEFVVEEYRVGGRLERLVVRRDDGVTEIYRNQRNDTLWAADEAGIGDVQNTRQWRIGGW